MRATWIQPLNISLCKETIEFLEEHAEEVGYRACGYLWLKMEARWKAGLSALELQRKMGWEVRELKPAEIIEASAFLDRLEGVYAAATFAPRDGQ